LYLRFETFYLFKFEEKLMKKVSLTLLIALTLAAIAGTVACGSSSRGVTFTQLPFLSNRTVSPASDLFLMALNGAAVTPVPFSSTSVYSPSVSADLKTYAFEADGNIWVSNATGSTQTQLTTAGGSYEVKVSPDGKKLVFNQSNPETENYNLWIMNVDGSGSLNLNATLPNGMAACYGGSFSADSTQIAMNCDGEGSSGVFTIKADGTGLATVTTQTSFVDTPVFTPDAKKILFVLYGQEGPSQTTIFSINLDGSTQTSVVVGAYEAMVLNSTLFYTAYDSTLENDRIYSSNLDGSNAVALTDGTTYDALGTAED
jgi:Tol biopolymer transport system component